MVVFQQSQIEKSVNDLSDLEQRLQDQVLALQAADSSVVSIRIVCVILIMLVVCCLPFRAVERCVARSH